MGRVDFAITTNSKEAQAFFNQGVAQLYGFWFAEAERSFLQAAKFDAGAAMAYWGIAMAAPATFLPMYQLALIPHRPPVVAPPNSPEARARNAIAAAETLRDSMTPRERLYVEALAAQHNPQLQDPDGAYIAAMKRLVESFPDDLHAKAILAVALENGYDSARSPKNGTRESLVLLRQVLAKEPDHAGALHFLIHGLEGGTELRDAVPSAERYAAMAPNIPHALHMPGHVYSQIGMFDEAVKAFLVAAAKEREYMPAGAQYSRLGYLHNELLLLHVLGSQGRYADAMSRIADLMSATENPAERGTADMFHQVGWFALVKVLVRFERWREILDGTTLPLPKQPAETFWYYWAQGLANASTSEVASARDSLARMDQVVGSNSIPPELQIARSELEAYIAVKAGDWKIGLEGLERSAKLEGALPYTDPTLYPRPVLELLGRAALDARDYHTAESAYRRALEKEPGSGRALWGLSKALQGLHRSTEARSMVDEFRRTWRGEALK